MIRDDSRLSVLVLCTGNSCRSILAEALINSLGGDRFVAHSAGSHPAGAVNPGALDKLRSAGIDTVGLRSKSWDEFTGDTAPRIDIVITVCDNAAGESCPIWHGSPVTVHWGIPDPAEATGAAAGPAFERAFGELQTRIRLMLDVPLESMDARERKDALARIHDAAITKERTDG